MNYEKFSPSVTVDFPEEWYDLSTADHFWLAWRMRVLKKMLTDQSLPVQEPLHVLEVGCGRGVLRTQMEEATRWTIDGVDLNEEALRHAVPSRGHTFLYDIYDQRPEFREAYDVLVLFDVVEHVERDGPFLAAACWHLKPGGWILMNVPAMPGLYSRYDSVAGHFRRYNVGSLRSLLKGTIPSLEIVCLQYWGFSLLPIAWLRKRLLKGIQADEVCQAGFKPPSRGIHEMLRMLMVIETTFLPHPPRGTSLMALAQKSAP